MFSKEESKKLRQEFWIAFGKSFPRKWILYNTKVKGLYFKFYFDKNKAGVALDIEHSDLEKRIELWEKLISLKPVLQNNYLPNAIYNDYFLLDNKKELSRIYTEIEGVTIHNKNTWQQTMLFLKDNMEKFEAFFNDYEDVLAA